MKTYQRGVVAFIRASGARVAILRDNQLLDYWRRFSQERYACISIEADREEVFRFVTWLNRVPGVNDLVAAAMHEAVAGNGSIRARQHLVRAWNGKMLAERRLV